MSGEWAVSRSALGIGAAIASAAVAACRHRQPRQIGSASSSSGNASSARGPRTPKAPTVKHRKAAERKAAARTPAGSNSEGRRDPLVTDTAGLAKTPRHASGDRGGLATRQSLRRPDRQRHAAHPNGGILMGNGYSWTSETCTGGLACNGGRSGLFGNGGNGFNGGNGGSAMLFGNGGKGGSRRRRYQQRQRWQWRWRRVGLWHRRQRRRGAAGEDAVEAGTDGGVVAKAGGAATSGILSVLSRAGAGGAGGRGGNGANGTDGGAGEDGGVGGSRRRWGPRWHGWLRLTVRVERRRPRRYWRCGRFRRSRWSRRRHHPWRRRGRRLGRRWRQGRSCRDPGHRRPDRNRRCWRLPGCRWGRRQ